MRVHKCRTMSLAAILRRARERRIACDRVRAIDFFKMKMRKAGNQPRNAAARGLHLDRDGDRVSVVLHAENHRQLAQSHGVQRFPEFPFAGSSIAQRNVSDLVALELYILELPVIRAGWPILRVLCEGWDCTGISAAFGRRAK